MYQALAKAAKNVKRRFHLIHCGWFPNEAHGTLFRNVGKEICPEANLIFVDGLDPEARTTIWYAADIFTSLTDNIQESFGLTPIEAMAAGLPVIVSDWDGYRDTVRDGIDGYIVPIRDSAAIVDRLARLDSDRYLLNEMAHSAQQRAAAYDIQEYSKRLLSAMNDR